MKKLFMKIFVVVLVIFSVSSCNQGNDTIVPDNFNKEEQTLIAFEKQLEEIKFNLRNQKPKTKGRTYVAATFDVSMKDGNYIVENIQYFTEFEYGFAQVFTKDSEILTRSSSADEGYGVKISCDETGEITECPKLRGVGSGMRQARCVADAIKACLDEGGCADVCKMTAVIY